MANRTFISRSAALALITAASSAWAQTPITLSPLAVTGQQAPGAPTGVTLGSLSVPVINPAGQVAFSANLAGTTVTAANNRAVFRYSNGGVSSLLRTGAPAPAISGKTIADVSDVLIDPRGCVAFSAIIAGSGVSASTNRAMYLGVPNSANFTLLARTGNAIPGNNAVRYKTLTPPVLSASGRVAFFATLCGTSVDASNDRAIIAGMAASPSVIARAGAAVPGLSGATFDSFNLPTIDATGRVAFLGFFSGASIAPSNDSALFTGLPGSVAVTIREGSQPNGLPVGLKLSAFSSPVVSPSSNLAFFSSITGPGVSQHTDMTIYAGPASAPVLVTRTGNNVPGLTNASFATLGYPVMNAAGKVAFVATFTGGSINSTNEVGVMTNAGGSLVVVAHKGDTAPGAADDSAFATFSNPSINAMNEVAFTATLTGSAVTAANDTGIYVYDADNALRCVARTGDRVTLNGSAKTIAALTMNTNSGAQDGRPAALSDTGQLVFAATFTDGSAALLLASLAQAHNIADIVSANGQTPADGVVNTRDYVAFMNAYFSGDSLADIVGPGGNPPGDGRITADDYVAFVNAYMNQ